MEITQIQKELYELELRKVALDSEVKQFQATKDFLKKKQIAVNLGMVGSYLSMFVPAIGLLGAGAGMVSLGALDSKYTKEERRLQAEIERRMDEKRLADRRIGELRVALREEERKELRNRTQEKKAA